MIIEQTVIEKKTSTLAELSENLQQEQKNVP